MAVLPGMRHIQGGAAQGMLLGLDGDARYGHYMEVVRSAPWAPKLATFAWKLVAGVLPFGKALGCRLAPGYKESTDECLLCRAPRHLCMIHRKMYLKI